MDDKERRFLDDARVALAGGADMNEDYNLPESMRDNLNRDVTRTRLYFAASNDWCLAIEWLVNHGADKNFTNPNRPRIFVPLQCAVAHGHSRAVALLLDMGAGLDAFNGAKYPPLHIAVLQRNMSIVKLLLGRGASLDTQNDAGRDAEAYARLQGEPLMVALLTDVRAAGGWKRYVREPEFSMLLLRYLCLRGRATPPANLARVFGPPPIPNDAEKARTPGRLASGSTPLPDEIFRHVLAFWNPRTSDA